MNQHKESSWEEEGEESGKRGWVDDMRSAGPKGAEGRGSPQREQRAEAGPKKIQNAETARQDLEAQDIVSSHPRNVTVKKELKPG